MHYEYFKIIDPAFVQSLLDGRLYMNSLNYFRTLESDRNTIGNKAQKDFMEGSCGTIPKDCLRQFGFHFEKEILNAMGNHVSLLSDNYGYNNLFCLYRLKIDEETKTIQRPSRQLTDFNDEGQESKVVIWFRNSEEFFRRLETALQTELMNHSLEYAIYGGVVYGNGWLNADGPGTQSAFHKELSYSYQEEWRLCILRREWKDEAVSFPIGNLGDLCEVISLEKFLDQLDQVFPGYTLVEHVDAHEPEIYHMFGNINAASRLMYAYMPQRLPELTRSDEAQADWHYTQFLNLRDRQQEIAPYLEKRLYHYKDMDHMELLAQYRLSQGRWVDATDAFCYMLQNAPEQIKNEPARFFFQLHTILMQHREPADAAKFLEMAVSQYELPKDTEKIMRSDCLMALGFHDQAIILFEELKRATSDPILEYNLAVSMFYLLRFEEADKHLRIFETYFSQSHEFACKANELQKLIECFRDHKLLKETAKEHPFQELTWTQKIEDVLQMARDSGQEVYLGIDALYQLEIAQKWELVTGLPEITTVPLTIARVVDLYRDTGAPVFYKIIQQLAVMKNIKIKSPDLKFYLAIDREFPELPAHYKMERALMIQETGVSPA